MEISQAQLNEMNKKLQQEYFLNCWKYQETLRNDMTKEEANSWRKQLIQRLKVKILKEYDK